MAYIHYGILLSHEKNEILFFFFFTIQEMQLKMLMLREKKRQSPKDEYDMFSQICDKQYIETET